MNREDIERIINFLNRTTENITPIKEGLENSLSESVSPVVMEAEDDLEFLQTILIDLMNESQEMLYLISEILP